MISWLLLVVIAFIAYLTGALSTKILASKYVFRKNLFKLGKGNSFISNFRRIYGWKGWLKLMLVELVKVTLPVLIGGWILGIIDAPEIGRAFAGFCVIMGCLYPVYYDLKGGHAVFAIIMTGMLIDKSLGISALIAFIAIIALTRYFCLASAAAAIITAVVAVLVVDDTLIVKIFAVICAVVLVKEIPESLRIFQGKTEKLSFEDDILYKFDSKF